MHALLAHADKYGPCDSCWELFFGNNCSIFLDIQSHTSTPKLNKDKAEVTIRIEHSTTCECEVKLLKEKTVTYETFERALKISDRAFNAKDSFVLFTEHILGIIDTPSDSNYSVFCSTANSNRTLILKTKADVSAIATGEEEVMVRVDHSLNCQCVEKERLGEKTVTLETVKRAMYASDDCSAETSLTVFTRHILGLEPQDPAKYLYPRNQQMTIENMLTVRLRH